MEGPKETENEKVRRDVSPLEGRPKGPSRSGKKKEGSKISRKEGGPGKVKEL